MVKARLPLALAPVPCHHGGCHGRFRKRGKRSAAHGTSSGQPKRERCDHESLGRMCCDERELVDNTCLPEAVDASRALFEPRWIPWQFEMDDHAAAVMKVEAFGCRVSGEKRSPAAVEGVLHRSAFAGGHASV